MRAISDRKLPEPYRSWIDRAAALPPNVRLFPRTIKVGTDLMFFLLLGVMFGGMGTMFFVGLWNFPSGNGGWPARIVLAGVGAALWLVPLLLGRRLWFAIFAQRDSRRGTLRQGIMVGPEGVLVRMEPNRCHPIAVDRFIVARRFPPKNSRGERRPAIIIETLDGKIDFFAERLAAGADEINRAAQKLWPSWSKPAPIERVDRQQRQDVESPRKMLRAAFWFGGSMLALFAGFAGIIILGDQSPMAPAVSLFVLVGVLLVAGSTVNLIYWFFRFKLRYRCPQCGGKCTHVDEALPALHYYCATCNVEWDTGIFEREEFSS